MAGSFEAKKHGYRQTQDGVVVSFVLHPNDLDAAFAVAPLGTRYMIGFAEIGDDEKPINATVHNIEGTPERSKAAVLEQKLRTPFRDLKRSTQAGIRCGDEQFKWFLMDSFPALSAENSAPADVVRALCEVSSRSELNTISRSSRKWDEIEKVYQNWLTEKRYKDSYR
jgi:hypothetical protein